MGEPANNLMDNLPTNSRSTGIRTMGEPANNLMDNLPTNSRSTGIRTMGEPTNGRSTGMIDQLNLLTINNLYNALTNERPTESINYQ
jgi:hypothetical protein